MLVLLFLSVYADNSKKSRNRCMAGISPDILQSNIAMKMDTNLIKVFKPYFFNPKHIVVGGN